MESIIIRARNNLGMPVRLTLTSSGYSEDYQILITIGHEGVALKTYYGVCADTDLLPNKEWEEIGSLNINIKSRVSISGKQ